ncbi:MAG: hypothetical protein ACOX9E_05410 [Lentisphaeria bacterium]|jgi:hypothetical protein
MSHAKARRFLFYPQITPIIADFWRPVLPLRAIHAAGFLQIKADQRRLHVSREGAKVSFLSADYADYRRFLAACLAATGNSRRRFLFADWGRFPPIMALLRVFCTAWSK